MPDSPESFDDMKSRLDEITNKVADSDTSLDEALELFEEAVNIGMLACDMAEIPVQSEESDSAEETATASDETPIAASVTSESDQHVV